MTNALFTKEAAEYIIKWIKEIELRVRELEKSSNKGEE